MSKYKPLHNEFHTVRTMLQKCKRKFLLQKQFNNLVPNPDKPRPNYFPPIQDLLYKSSFKAETDGLLAGQFVSALETTTGMKKEDDSPDSEYLLELREYEVRSNSWTYICSDACEAGMKVLFVSI